MYLQTTPGNNHLNQVLKNLSGKLARNKLLWFSISLLIVTVLSGCSSGGGGSDDKKDPPSETPTPTATLSLGTPSAFPAVIPPSASTTQVTFLSMINGNSLPPSVLLLDELDADGNVAQAGIAQLRDDGELADLTRGDRMYTGTLMINNVLAVEKYYRVRSENDSGTVTSDVLNFWISGCPATSRPSDQAKAVLDSISGSIIFSNEVMIRTATGIPPDLSHINDIAAAVNGHVVGCIPALRQYLVEIEGDGNATGVYAAIDTLQVHPDIESAFPNGQTLEPPTPPTEASLICDGVIDTQCQWYLDRVRAPQAWNLAGGGDPQRGVAVIDFGVDCTRGDMDCDRELFNEDPIDHGTGVAGLIGSRQNPTGMVGVAWNTSLYPYSFLGKAGSQYKLNELITASLGQPEVRVINVSAGTRSDFDGQIKQALCTAISTGRLIVAAAGNPAGNDAVSCQLSNVYPAQYNISTEMCDNGIALSSGMIVVGATDIDNQLASWDNNSQPQCSNQLYVDMFAPGKEIVTLSTELGYSLKNGTSYAAAMVSGAASVLWTVYPGDSPQQIQSKLLSRSALLTDVETTSPLYTQDTRVAGQRFLDMYKAVGGQDAIPVPDTTPDTFSIPSQTDVPIQTYIVSDAMTITGMDSPTPISIDGGFYQLDNGAFTSADGVILNGQQVNVQLLSSDNPETTTQAILTIGGISQAFSITTRTVINSPGDFQFLSQHGVARNSTINSNTQTISGISDGTNISVTNGEYSLNGSAFSNISSTVNDGDSIQLRLTSAAEFATLTQTTLTIGSVSRNFSVTTELADTTPDFFSFNPMIGVARNTTVTSNSISVTGINAPAIISVSGGNYAIDGGAFTSTTGMVNIGQTVQIQATSPIAFGNTSLVSLTIGGVTGTFSISTLAADTIPDDFSFNAQSNVPVSTATTSNTISVTGINTATTINIINGEYTINGGAFTSAPGSVNNNDTVAARVTSAPTLATSVNATLTIGGISRIFSVLTEGADTAPDGFSFTPQADAPLDSPVVSNSISVSGINTAATISVTNGEYAINGGAFTALQGTINNGQTVQLRLQSAATPDTTTTATLNIGGVTANFDVTTLPADTTPDGYSFNPQTGVALSSLTTSNSVIVTGINAPAPISVVNGEYSINGSPFTNAAGTINNGQAVQVRLTAAATPETTSTATVTIGGIDAVFNVTTVAADTTPDNFNFAPQTNAPLDTLLSSNSPVITGINTAAPISIAGAGAEYAIDGGTFTANAGSISNNQTVQVRLTSASTPETTTSATVTIGGVSVAFEVTTLAADTTPDAFSFNAQTNVALSTQVISNIITVTGINTQAPISIVNGEYAINGGAFTSTAGMVNNNDTAQVRLTSAPSADTTSTATLTIGGIPAAFNVTTIAADTTPDGFIFDAQTDVTLSTLITSNSITVTGINSPAPISVSNGEYAINGGSFTSSPGSVNNGNSVQVRLTSAATEGTTTTATVTIGGVNADFNVTTLAADTTPPVITLNGENPLLLFQGETYVEAGATAIDDVDGSVNVVIGGSVDTNNIGTYFITYTATDNASNSSQETREINVLTQNTPFVTTWKTDNPGTTANNQIMIGTSAGGYNYRVEWGDGNVDNSVTGNISHTYAAPGTYTVSITGAFPQIYFDITGYDNNKLLSVEQWGSNQWLTMQNAFYNCSNLVINATDAPNLSLATDLNNMFAGASSMNQGINNWNVSNITNMSGMFSGASSFNQDLNNWDVSSVINMSSMFQNTQFNGNISTWNVASVTDMSFMFRSSSFNQDISGWNVSSVTSMSNMFQGNFSFNQNIGAWNTGAVTDMSGMFQGTNFNMNIDSWNVSSVTNMRSMFESNSVFNQNLSSWNTSAVTNMSRMFHQAAVFNGDISAWNVSSVTTMHRMFWRAREFNGAIGGWNTASLVDTTLMFDGALAFNQPIGGWDVSGVTSMVQMFLGAWSFNQDISAWDVSSVTNMSYMFEGASAFDQDIGGWNVSSVVTFARMFRQAAAFNRDLSNWNVSAANDMHWMFKEATSFNGNITTWNVSNVTNMDGIFDTAPAFNQDISGWDVSSVTNMNNMFRDADAFSFDITNWDVSSATSMNFMFYRNNTFNQNISAWNVSSVTQMSYMFEGATAFNQDIGGWDVSSVTQMIRMFNGATSFDQDLSAWDVTSVNNMSGMFQGVTLSTPNYDALLTGWSSQNLLSSVQFSGGNSQYSVAGQAARDVLTNTYSWIIVDGGLAP